MGGLLTGGLLNRVVFCLTAIGLLIVDNSSILICASLMLYFKAPPHGRQNLKPNY